MDNRIASLQGHSEGWAEYAHHQALQGDIDRRIARRERLKIPTMSEEERKAWHARQDEKIKTAHLKTPRQLEHEAGVTEFEKEAFFGIIELPTYIDDKLRALGED